MIKVDEVFPVDIRASIGPTGTIKRLYSNRDYFRERGYDMTIFANHSTGSHIPYHRYELKEMTALPSQNSCSAVARTGMKKKIVSRMKKKVYNSQSLSYLIVKYKEQKANELWINSYIKRERKPDIIVFHEFLGCYNYLKKRQPNDRARVVVFLHSDGKDISMSYKTYPKLVGSSIFKELFEKYLYTIHHADRVVYISKLAKKAFFELHPDFDDRKVYTVVNGIDDKPISKVEPSCRFKYRICTSGTVCERKGQYIIIEAMKRMDKDVLKDVHLTVLGSGPDFAHLVEDVKANGLKEHVTFKGNVPNPEVHDLLCAENIYCLMSNNEGLPIAIIEAMRAGLPVISTRVAGIPEQVDERNGFLLNPNIDELTCLLNKLPFYDWSTLGRNSRKRFEEEFTFERMMKDYADMFDSLK